MFISLKLINSDYKRNDYYNSSERFFSKYLYELVDSNFTERFFLDLNKKEIRTLNKYAKKTKFSFPGPFDWFFYFRILIKINKIYKVRNSNSCKELVRYILLENNKFDKLIIKRYFMFIKYLTKNDEMDNYLILL